MKVTVWCVKDWNRDIQGCEAWSGEMLVLPRAGDYLVIHDGWAATEVLRVFHNLYEGTATIEISPDYTGEYRNAVGGEG